MTHSSWRQNCLNQIQQRFQDCDLGEKGNPLSKTRMYLVSGAIATGMVAFAVMRSASVTNATIPDVIKLDEITQAKATAAARVSQKDEQVLRILIYSSFRSPMPTPNTGATYCGQQP